MTNQTFFITWKGHKPFQLVIDDQKTILDLKIMIAAHHNETYTGFNIFNGIEEIGNDKNSCSIATCKLNRVVRCADDYNPGYTNK